MDSAAREALARRVLEHSSADQTEVLVWSTNSALTRFTHNMVHQNVAEADVSVRIRAIAGKRTGVATTNALDEQSLHDAVSRALEMAKLSPEDPQLPPLPSRGDVRPPEGAYAEQTAHATPHTRAQMCDSIFETAEQRGYWCAGFATTSTSGVSTGGTSSAAGSSSTSGSGGSATQSSAGRRTVLSRASAAGRRG